MENNKIRSISFNNINTEKLKLLDNIIINAKINAYINHKLRAFFKQVQMLIFVVNIIINKTVKTIINDK